MDRSLRRLDTRLRILVFAELSGSLSSSHAALCAMILRLLELIVKGCDSTVLQMEFEMFFSSLQSLASHAGLVVFVSASFDFAPYRISAICARLTTTQEVN
jgi:hypothetical protein